MLGVDRCAHEDDRELREDVGLQHGHEALDDHDEHAEGDDDGRDGVADLAELGAGEEEDQAYQGEHHLPVLRHRINLSAELEIENISADNILLNILNQIEVPRT